MEYPNILLQDSPFSNELTAFGIYIHTYMVYLFTNFFEKVISMKSIAMNDQVKDMQQRLGSHLREESNKTIGTESPLAFKFLIVGEEDGDHGTILSVTFGQIGYDGNKMISIIEEWLDSQAILDRYSDIRITHLSPDVNTWQEKFGMSNVHIADSFPILILVKQKDGRVEGVWGYDTHSSGSIAERVGSMCCEPNDVAALLEAVPDQGVFAGAVCMSHIEAASMDDAITATPESKAGQKSVVVYDMEAHEWLSGLWNNPEKEIHEELKGLRHLSSVADFHGTPVSSLKKQSRPSFEAIDFSVKASTDILYGAAEKAVQRPEYKNYEDHPSLLELCEWWNTTAPEGMRHAKTFRLYAWNPRDEVFIAFDPEEPVMNAEQFSSHKPIALFEGTDGRKVAAIFLKGHDDVAETRWGINIYQADGEVFWDVGCGKEDYDESFYSYKSLHGFADILRDTIE